MDGEKPTIETNLKKKTGKPNKKTNVTLTDKIAVTPIQTTSTKDTIKVKFTF